MFYEFTFNNGVAIIQETESKRQVVAQPHNPNGVSPEPWASEDEARAWAEGAYGYYLTAESNLIGEIIEETSSENVVETSSEEETAVIEQPAQGE